MPSPDAPVMICTGRPDSLDTRDADAPLMTSSKREPATSQFSPIGSLIHATDSDTFIRSFDSR